MRFKCCSVRNWCCRPVDSFPPGRCQLLLNQWRNDLHLARTDSVFLARVPLDCLHLFEHSWLSVHLHPIRLCSPAQRLRSPHCRMTSKPTLKNLMQILKHIEYLYYTLLLYVYTYIITYNYIYMLLHSLNTMRPACCAKMSSGTLHGNRKFLSLPVTSCHFLSLPVTSCHFLSLPVTSCPSPPSLGDVAQQLYAQALDGKPSQTLTVRDCLTFARCTQCILCADYGQDMTRLHLSAIYFGDYGTYT